MAPYLGGVPTPWNRSTALVNFVNISRA
jgi:hypothetical protein